MSRTLIIAEAGVNHNGSLSRALEMVDAAAAAGADIVKFQTFSARQLVTTTARKAQYQIANTGNDDSQLSMLQSLQLSQSDHHVLASRARERGIGFMSTAFDAASLKFLATLDMPAIKIPSGDITCAPLLLQSARLRKPLIVSTGMCTLADIERALGVIAFGLTTDQEPSSSSETEQALWSEEGRNALLKHVTLLHCVTEYPAPPSAINLRAMDTMSVAFGLPVGYSDHTLGIDVALAAVARGASIIEKHFTLDRRLPGPDHVASLEPAEFTQLVSSIRNVEQALGSAWKGPGPAEINNLPIARRSVVAARPIRLGERLTREMLAVKRPATGVSPMQIWDLIGKVATRDYEPDEIIDVNG